jgi:hypothetical protein
MHQGVNAPEIVVAARDELSRNATDLICSPRSTIFELVMVSYRSLAPILKTNLLGESSPTSAISLDPCLHTAHRPPLHFSPSRTMGLNATPPMPCDDFEPNGSMSLDLPEAMSKSDKVDEVEEGMSSVLGIVGTKAMDSRVTCGQMRQLRQTYLCNVQNV